MRIVLFSLIAVTCCEFVGCTPMKSENNPIDSYEIKKDRSLIYLAQKIRDADTILLTSHVGDSIIDGKTRLEIVPHKILEEGKINWKIIKEQKAITRSNVDTLIDILSLPKSAGDSLKCGFDPHHTILIINKNKVSFIDIWFACYGEATSDDLENILPLGKTKVEKLFVFFKKLGFKYRMPETVFSDPQVE